MTTAHDHAIDMSIDRHTRDAESNYIHNRVQEMMEDPILVARELDEIIAESDQRDGASHIAHDIAAIMCENFAASQSSMCMSLVYRLKKELDRRFTDLVVDDIEQKESRARVDAFLGEDE